jgi:hypothetical protein
LSDTDQDAVARDRVVESEYVAKGDVEDPHDALDRPEAFEVIGDDDRPLAPPTKPTQPPGLAGFLSLGWIVEQAERAIDQGCSPALAATWHQKGAVSDYHRPPLVVKTRWWSRSISP